MASAEAKQAISTARTDLAYRSGVGERDIVIVQVKSIEWPDAGLGCPEPHSRHEPRSTMGYLIVLDSMSREYEYHADDRGRVVYCGKRRQG